MVNNNNNNHNIIYLRELMMRVGFGRTEPGSRDKARRGGRSVENINNGYYTVCPKILDPFYIVIYYCVSKKSWLILYLLYKTSQDFLNIQWLHFSSIIVLASTSKIHAAQNGRKFTKDQALIGRWPICVIFKFGSVLVHSTRRYFSSSKMFKQPHPIYWRW